MKREKEWVGGYEVAAVLYGDRGGLTGSDTGMEQRNRGRGIPGQAHSGRQCQRSRQAQDNYANDHRMPRTYRDDSILIFTITL